MEQDQRLYGQRQRLTCGQALEKFSPVQCVLDEPSVTVLVPPAGELSDFQGLATK